jgi:DNA-binding NtrC family response regulator
VAPRGPGAFEPARHIVVADQDPAIVQLLVETLRSDGHVVFDAYDADAAARIARSLDRCDLVISNTCVAGVEGIDLIAYLRQVMPALPILYLASPGRSTPVMEAALPQDVPILRVPFRPQDLRAAVVALLGSTPPGPLT